MNLQTRISRPEGPTSSPRPRGAGIRARRIALTIVLAALILLTVLMTPARAQDEPGVEAVGDTVSVGEEVFAGDGCARAGDVAAGDCAKDTGKNKGGDGDAAGRNAKPPEEPSDRPQNGGGSTNPDEESDPEDTSGATSTTGSGDLDETTGGTTVTETTAPNLAETTGPEVPESTAAGKSAVCPAAPPEDAQTATVARAIDGDTVELQEPVNGYDRVRLIGVDTPEMMGGENRPPEAGAEEARTFTAEALEGEEVALETDEEVEDNYGRLLAYVWIAADAKADSGRPEFFNRTLVDEGHADVMTVEPNDAYSECLAAAEDERQDEAPDTTRESQEVGGDKDGNEGLLRRLRNLISSEDPSGEQPTANEDQYGQGGTTGGPLPAETVSENGLQGDTSNEGTAPDPVAGSTNEQYGRGEGQEPAIQEPEAQDDPVQEPLADPPARSSELGPGPELPDSTPDELAVPQPSPPAEIDTEIDAGTDASRSPDQAQITSLPDTSGVSLTRLAALPAGVLLICSGLVAALVRGPKQAGRNHSGG